MGRRRFLRLLGGAGTPVVLGGFWPQILCAQDSGPAPGSRIAVVVIGLGTAGVRALDAFLAQPDCRVLGVCDVDQLHAEAAKDRVNRHYGNQDCRAYYDFRPVLARPDLDAVVLALPDHWHAIPAVHAARAGLDVYGEAPLAHTVREGQAVRDTVRRYGRIWQTAGSLRTSKAAQRAAGLARQGRLGRLRAVEVGFPGGHTDRAGTAGQMVSEPPPAYLDYEMWLGPAPWAPYSAARVHGNWRWHLDYGGGSLMECAGPLVDLAFWGMGETGGGPIEVEAQGEFPAAGLWNAPTRCRVEVRYRSGVALTLSGTDPDIRQGVRWIGERGWVWVDGDQVAAEPQAILAQPPATTDPEATRPGAPHREFLDSVKTRRPTACPADAAQRAAIAGHIGLIALRLGRKIRFDPETEEIPNDPVANRLLGVAFREPWRL